ncbi:trimeric intracellular cation channel family protein [Rothia uropygialis]|uniref:trimeric intracellular cation channel family protein n=1 Tax=Kocuria sp. 36 TaxID=1415402 RepID=UPI00101D9B98|nr:TRIC cation channel family protein [Kocuria sp. 36]
MTDWDPSIWFRAVDVSAVLANGLLGGALARAFRFDVVGFAMLAIVTGMGGGLIRDVLLNTGFPIALTDSGYWIAAIVASILAYTIDLGARWADRALIVVDFIGMGCWAATGTSKSLMLGLHWIPSVMLGVTTAVGGGVIRDVMVNRIPSIFGGSSLYATIALFGGLEMAFFSEVLHRPNLGMLVSILTCGTVGVLARWRNWRLPEPIELKVPRPRLKFSFASRPRSQRLEGWAPGQPLTENLEAITEEQVRAHREKKRRRFRRRR